MQIKLKDGWDVISAFMGAALIGLGTQSLWVGLGIVALIFATCEPPGIKEKPTAVTAPERG
jgi:hypothetical protein